VDLLANFRLAWAISLSYTAFAEQPPGKGKDKATNDVFAVYVELFVNEEATLVENGPLFLVARCQPTATAEESRSEVIFSSTENNWLAGSGAASSFRNGGDEFSQGAAISVEPVMFRIDTGAVSSTGQYIEFYGHVGVNVGSDCFAAGRITSSLAP
jgi:hypothetical protein